MALSFLPVAGQPFSLEAFVGRMATAVADRFGAASLACSSIGNPIVELWSAADRSSYWLMVDVWLNMGETTAVSVEGLRLALGNALQATGGAQRRVVATDGVTVSSSAAAVFSEAAEAAVVGADSAAGVSVLPWPVSFDPSWSRLDTVGAISSAECRVSDRMPSSSSMPPGFRQTAAVPMPTPTPFVQGAVRDIVTNTAGLVARRIVYGVLGVTALAVVGGGTWWYFHARQKPQGPMDRKSNPAQPTARDVAELRQLAGKGAFSGIHLAGIEAALAVAWTRDAEPLRQALPDWRAYVRSTDSDSAVLRQRRFTTREDHPAFRFDAMKYALNNAWDSAKSSPERAEVRRIVGRLADRYGVTLDSEMRGAKAK